MKNQTKNNKSQKILVAPLSWGLGHAARCVPIINALLQNGYEVILASDSEALHLLQSEFPHLRTITLPAYNIKYWWRNMNINILLQLPKILYTIITEYIDIQKIIKKENINIIITDNRYGCWHSTKKSIFVGHQINIKTGNYYLNVCVNAIQRAYLNFFFSEVWIPDFADKKINLAGELSHGRLPKRTKYIGVLSRLSAIGSVAKSKQNLISILVLLSGPEPQRSIFEKKILSQILLFLEKNKTPQFTIISGLPSAKMAAHHNPNLTIIPFATATELNAIIANTDILICRPGYTTLMDLVVLQKKAILVPTPGQTEQTYLAAQLTASGVYYSVSQTDFDLEQALRESEKFSNHIPKLAANTSLLHQAINDLSH